MLPRSLCLAAVVTFVPVTFAHTEPAALALLLGEQIAQHPSDVHLRVRRAECYRELGQLNEAQADLQSANRLAPGSSEIALQLATVLLSANRAEDAQQVLKPLLTREPANAAALILDARAKRQLHDDMGAYAAYTRAIDALPEPRPEFYQERASLAVPAPLALKGIEEGLSRLGPVTALTEQAIRLELSLNRVDAALAHLDALAAAAERKETWLKRRGDVLAAATRPAESRRAYLAALAAIDHLPPWLRESESTQQLAHELHQLLTPIKS